MKTELSQLASSGSSVPHQWTYTGSTTRDIVYEWSQKLQCHKANFTKKSPSNYYNNYYNVIWYENQIQPRFFEFPRDGENSSKILGIQIKRLLGQLKNTKCAATFFRKMCNIQIRIYDLEESVNCTLLVMWLWSYYIVELRCVLSQLFS